MSTAVNRREFPTNTTEQIHEYLATAETILRERGYDPMTHAPLLVQVLILVSQKQITFEQVQPLGVDLSALTAGLNGR